MRRAKTLEDIRRRTNDELIGMVARLTVENERLRAVVRFAIGCALNELAVRKLPQEWSPDSGIGVMLAAIGCDSIRFDDAVRAALTPAKDA